MFVSNGIEIARYHANFQGISMQQIDNYVRGNNHPMFQKVKILDTDEKGQPNTFLYVAQLPYLKKRDVILKMKKLEYDTHVDYLIHSI